MATAKQSDALQQWLPRLDEQLLPVLPAPYPRVQALLKKREVPLQEVARTIASDPVLSLHLLRECQRLFGRRLGGVPGNIQHCVSLMGLDKLRALLSTLQPLRGDPNDPALHPYLRAIGNSVHTLAQIGAWTRYRSQPGADHLLQAALLHGAAEWSLWHRAGSDMQIIDRLIRQERIPPRHAEQAVLGCSLDEIALGLGQRWRFPADVLECLDSPQLPDAGFLLRRTRDTRRDPNYRLPARDHHGHLIRSAGATLHMGEWLTKELALDWYSPGSRRCIAIAAVYLNIPEEELPTLIRDCALAISHEWTVPGVVAPAANLVWPVQPRRRRRLKLRQLSAAVDKLRAAPAKAQASATQPTRPTPAKPTLTKPAAAPPRPAPIGLPNNNLPPELDRDRLLNVPPPPIARADTSNRHAGFRSPELKQTFEQFLRTLQDPLRDSSAQDDLKLVANQLHACTTLTRVVAMLHQRQTDQVESLQAFGCDHYPGLQRLKVELRPVNLFTHLLKQSASVWISPDRPNPMNALVPGSLKQASQASEFFVMSVFDHRGPFGLIYADLGTDMRQTLSNQEYSAFKAACTACSKRLITRGRQDGSP
ncbi:MAG TPA: HDOD domain-containing protein [Dongiaceae bacterium]|nr:HDOD domain-containing protein [Dongiaceae bacterium]